jgi:hypothetical protein
MEYKHKDLSLEHKITDICWNSFNALLGRLQMILDNIDEGDIETARLHAKEWLQCLREKIDHYNEHIIKDLWALESPRNWDYHRKWIKFTK